MTDSIDPQAITVPQSYAEAHTLWTRTRRRKLGHNTTLEQRGYGLGACCYALRYHSTDVVTWHPDGRVTLDSGGWQTATTRKRWGWAGHTVSLSGGVAGYAPADPATGFPDWSREVAYADGLTVHPDGTITGHGGPAEPIRAERRRALARERRAVKALADAEREARRVQVQRRELAALIDRRRAAGESNRALRAEWLTLQGLDADARALAHRIDRANDRRRAAGFPWRWACPQGDWTPGGNEPSAVAAAEALARQGVTA